MTKCDGYLDRLEKGLMPICVEACSQRAIEFGDIEELRQRQGTNAVVELFQKQQSRLPRS